ncbi:MAG: UbiD family decarboxylase, partial [Planctomycetes bacterium]|nr:UbiD family decarboxylase [Planctomycetota bacterium]
MAYRDLQSFVRDLDEKGQLKRIGAEVDPVLEITAITDRMSKLPAAGNAPPPETDPVHGGRGGHALLFENVKGSDFPVGINLFGSYERMRMAFGVESVEALADRVQSLIKPEVPSTLIEKIKKLPQLAKLASYGPKIVKHGMCQEVVHTDDASLFDLPIVQCWPHDGEPGFGGKPADYREGTGRYITFSAVQAKDPETGVYNLGMYRVQVFEKRLAAAHWHIHHDGARIFRKYQKRGEKMPMACVFGGESILPFAATCPLPPDVSELLFAGFLNDGGIELVPCKTIP